jgi:NAD(P) transhydrogenase subunit alpha
VTEISALYLIFLAAIAGYVLIARVPVILHTPTLSGSNFIHGIVLIGAMLALANASGMLEQIIGFVAVTAAAANVVGGFIVTDRMLALFGENTSKSSAKSSTDRDSKPDTLAPDSTSMPGEHRATPVHKDSSAKK